MTDNHIRCKYSINVHIWLPRKMLQAFHLTHQLFNSGLDIMLWGAGCDAEPRGMVLAFDKASVFEGEHSTHPTLELVFSKTGSPAQSENPQRGGSPDGRQGLNCVLKGLDWEAREHSRRENLDERSAMGRASQRLGDRGGIGLKR